MTSRSSQDRTTEALADIEQIQSLPATFVAQAGALATVVQGNSKIQVRSVSQYPPNPGDAVRLELRGTEIVMLGPSVPKSATGRVTAVGSPRCTVEYPSGSGVTAQLGYSSTYTPTVGDNVAINWATGGTVDHKLSILPNAPIVDVPIAPGPVLYHPAPFQAQSSGSFRSGSWWTNDVRSGATNSGAWFYGSTIRDTIPDSAAIVSSRLYLPLRSSAGASPRLGRHSAETKPGGALSIVAASPLEPRSGWVDIPVSLVDYLKANPGGLGFLVGFSDTIWNGQPTDGLSGALDISYLA